MDNSTEPNKTNIIDNDNPNKTNIDNDDPNKIIVFCLPGQSFPGKFVDCWTELLAWCLCNNIKPILSRKQSCNIYYVRQLCCGGDVTRGKNQKPFNGEIPYDYMMWIDSDMIFNTIQFEKLLSHDVDIVSGLYAFEGGNGFTCGKLDENFYRDNGYMEYLTPETLKKKSISPTGLFEVDYAGFGFMLIKYGVFEKLEYPWFRPVWYNIDNQSDFTMEDVGFCIKAREAGFNIWIDASVQPGHLKQAIY